MAQYGIKEIMDFTIANYHPEPLKREPILTVDYAQVTDVEQAGERIFIEGGRGKKRLLSFDHTKTTAINVTLPLVDIRMLSLISGDDVEDKISEVFKREIVYVTEGKINLSKPAMANSLYLYKLEGNRDLGKRIVCRGLEEVKTEIDLESDLDITQDLNGKEVVAYFHTKTSKPVQKLSIDPTKFPKAISVYGDTLFRNQFTELDEVYNMVGHKGRIQPNYTLSMNASDVTTLELVIDLYVYKDQSTQQEVFLEYIKDETDELVDGEVCSPHYNGEVE